MANYCANARTNYFRVTDEEKYSVLFSKLVSDNGNEVHDFTKEENGVKLHCFGCFGSIDFLVSSPDAEDPEYDWDVFTKKLQEILPEDEAFIYLENGHEKLCLVSGFSVIVTKDKVEYVDIRSTALEKAREMLNNKNYYTQTDC